LVTSEPHQYQPLHQQLASHPFFLSFFLSSSSFLFLFYFLAFIYLPL
jgi:hypothetical protein